MQTIELSEQMTGRLVADVQLIYTLVNLHKQKTPRDFLLGY